MPCTQTSFLASMGGDENKTLLFAVYTAPLDEDLPGVVRVPYNHAPIEVFTEVDAQRYRISSSLRGTIPRARHVVVVRTPHYRRGETSRLTWWATLVVHRGGRGGTDRRSFCTRMAGDHASPSTCERDAACPIGTG